MPPSLPNLANTVIVLDFETTGLSPDFGDRAIEIGAVKIEQGVVVDQFQGLMNPGRRISAFIEDYTGITNVMLKTAPPCSDVMTAFADFAGDADLVAHNASFDKRFLYAELERVRRRCYGEFACSMLTSEERAYSYPCSSLCVFTPHQPPWFPRSSVGIHTPLHTYLRYAFPRGAWERENIDPGCHH